MDEEVYMGLLAYPILVLLGCQASGTWRSMECWRIVQGSLNRVSL